MIVKYQNLSLLHKPISKKLEASFCKNLKTSNFILGKDLLDFENNFSSYCKTKYAIGVSNGSDAIFLALKALNLKKGSEVILSAMTYISAAYSVLFNNLKLVLCDIDINTGLMNLELLKKKITKKTKCIISTDFAGNTVSQTQIKKIIEGKKIYIINDSSHSHGSFDCDICKYKKNDKCCRKGKQNGSSFDISCFSLYPGKNLGALGDAGVITTNNKLFYKELIKLRNFGSEKKYYHKSLGYNFKLDNIQAGFLNLKLKKLDHWNYLKCLIATYYDNNIKNKKIKLLLNSKGSSYYAFIILTQKRDKLIRFLNKKKIQTNIYYPFSINKHIALKKYFENAKYPNSEKFSRQALAIPICSTLKLKQIKYVVRALNLF